MSATTVDTAELSKVREAAEREAARAAAKAAEAQARLDAAEAEISARKQARVRAWAEAMVSRQRDLEKAAERRVLDGRDGFQAAIAAGDLGDALGHYYRWSEAVGAALGLKAQLSRALYEVGEDPNRVAELSQRVRPPAFYDALSNAVAHTASIRSHDAEDEAQRQLEAALRGEVSPDGE